MRVVFISHPLTESPTLSLHDALPISHHFRSVDPGIEIGQIPFRQLAGAGFAGGRLLDGRFALDGGFAESGGARGHRSEEHTSELQSLRHLVCRLLLEKKKSFGPRQTV